MPSSSTPSTSPMQTGDSMQLALPQEAILGEGLHWKASTQQWWWTDIESATIYAWSPATGSFNQYPVHDRVGSFAHCVSGRILLGTAKWLCMTDGDALHRQTAVSKALPVVQLAAVDPLEARTRINDGRTDRAGRFVFGTINETPERRPIASFFQFSKDAGLRRLALPAVGIANSICFSLDGRTLYFTDTVTRRIHQCDYDSASAQVTNIALFADVAGLDWLGAQGYPDGSTIDRHGCLWNAQWGAGRVVQFSPGGEFMRSVNVPVKNPTCPAFGGPQFDQLTVTTARQELDAAELAAMPASGSLFSIQMDQPTGLPEVLYRD